jgi:hypothetical protein
VDRKQRFLHDILWVDAAPDDSPTSENTHDASCPLEEIAVGFFISRDRGSHKPGKFRFVLAVQACFPPQLRLPTALCYVAGKI